MASNQVYSQGFNFSSFIQKGVDPRTGQYTCAITLYEAPAQARNCPPLKLSISYNPLNSSQDIGLGKGWSFNNLSYYQHRQSNTKSLFLSTGEHFQVTETSSGSVTVKDRKLKSFLFKKKEDDKGKKTYQIIHKSGQIEVLHNTNDTYNITVPVKIYAANGRLLKLKWTRFGEQPRLSQIQEGSQVLLELKYSDSQVTIVRSPNTAEASTSVLVRRTNQLVELKLPREKSEDVLASWKFTYKSFNNGSIICLSTVSSPAGLLEQVQYKSDGHRLPEGAPYETIPYVISHTVQPRGQQPAIKTTYSYSHRNFLGYDGGVRWKGGEDNLYRVPDEYKYTSTVQMEGGAKTEYTYNKFHLIIDTLRRKGSKEVTQHIEYYALKNKGFKDQPAQYQLPKIARTTYRYTSAKKQEVSRTETSRYSFDEWGNPTSAEEPNGIKTDRVYYPAAGEKDTTTGEVYCPANPHLFQLYLKQETVTPAASEYTTPTRSKHYTYRELPTAAGALTGSFVVAQQIQSLEDNQCVFSTQYTYTNQPATEDHGRLQQQTTSLFGQSKYSTTTDWMYQYDPNNSERLTQTTQTRTFDGHTIQDATSYSRYSGLALTHKDQAGVDTVFEYNKLNRLVKTTLAPGTPYQATRQYEYGALSGESGYQLTLTDAKGVRTRYITDGLERLVRVEKQDDDGSWDSKGAYSGTFRLVQKRNYNTLGQHIETVDIDWLRSNQGEPTKQRQSQRMEYDDWGQVCKITQSTGVVISSLTDPIELTRTEGVEGEGQNKIQSNLFGAPTQTVLLKRDGTVYSKFEYAYDGLGRLVKQKDQLGRTTQYQADCFDRSIQTREPDGRIINTQYATQSAAALPVSVNVNDHAIGQQSFDGLCRVTSRKVGVRTTAQSYQGNAPKPSWITTPKGGQYNLTHEPVWDYALTKLTSSDSSNAYKYDSQTATMLQSRNEYSEQDLQYFPSGLVARETIRTKDDSTLSTQSTYSMSGKLQCYTDVHGQKHEIQYDDFGRPQCLVQGKLRVTFSYDQKDRLCENCVQDEENNQSLTTSLRYDDFSREIERAVRKGEETLYRLSQAYGETSLITTRKLEDGQGNLLRHETFQYDAHNRLIDYQCNGSQPPADEYGHGLQHQQFSFDNYNNLTQVFTTFQDGTTNIKRYAYSDTDLTQVVQITNTNSTYPPTIDLAYDENGCLTRDERGRILEYDTLSRLSTVRDANTKEILAQYRYDSAGKLVCQEVPGKSNTYLHYRANALVALTVGDSKVSYISDGQVYWGQSLQQDGQIHTQLWSSDAHQSILAWLDTQQSEVIHHQSYTPYGGSAAAVSSIGFNGQWRDPVTGWYHLGNGYRVYNPVLMRFHTPDRWSPFTSGEINPYAYCLGDPINRIDPSGHLSIFGIDFSNRDLAVMGVGLGIGILVGILTAGAGFAIAAGVASDVATGFLYDVTSGKSPTWASVGTDALYGVIGGIAGEALGVGLKAASRGLSKILGRSASLTITEAESQSVRRLPALEANVIGRGRLVGAPAGEDYFEMAYINNLEGVPGHDALVTHGNWVGQLMCWNATRGEFFMTDAARVARYNLVRNANPELRRMANAFRHVDDRPFTLLACHGATSAGQVLANVLNRDVRCFYGRLQPNARFRNWDQVFHRLQREGGIEDVFGPVESVIRRPQGPPEPMEIL